MGLLCLARPICLSLLLIILPYTSQGLPPKDLLSNDCPVDMECLNTTCGSAYETCLSYSKCSSLLTCITKCLEGFDSDTSLMKSTTQSCVNTCSFSYADIFYVALARCLTDNKCVKLPPIPSTCRYPDKIKMTRKYQLSDLKGGWWKVRGYNPAYDCLPCQHTFFDPVQFENNKFTYRPSFKQLTVNNTYLLVNGTILVDLDDTEPGQVIEIDYYLFGVPVRMSWYALDGAADGSIVLVYYCGNVLDWNYEGAMILSRSTQLPSQAEDAFEHLVSVNTGLDYTKFCSPQFKSCPN